MFSLQACPGFLGPQEPGGIVHHLLIVSHDDLGDLVVEGVSTVEIDMITVKFYPAFIICHPRVRAPLTHPCSEDA